MAAVDIKAAAASAPLEIRIEGAIAHLCFNRPEKRNAINDETIAALSRFLDDAPRQVRCVVLSGAGGNFSSGLDLSEHVFRRGETVFEHSRGWHRVIEQIQHGGLPFVALLTGAVMGGGLEIASACHVRIAEAGAKFRMPEGQRGIFVGGGAAANLSRLIGASRLIEMMLTGRTYDAAEARDIGMVHYLTETGQGSALADQLALRAAENSRLVNALIIQGVSRIADMSRADGLFTESLAAALSTTSEDAVEGLNAFLEKRKPMFK